MTDTTIINHCDCVAGGGVGLIRVYVRISLCLCMCVFIGRAPINQNLSLVPNGDRLSSKKRDVTVPGECLLFVRVICGCVHLDWYDIAKTPITS